MKKIPVSLLTTLVLCELIVTGVFAQASQLTLKISRDWGYGGFNSDIQGLFTLRVTGPTDLTKVTYYIDQTVLGEVTQSPFSLQFSTDNYPLGWHDLTAIGLSSSGQEYRSNAIRAEFVPAKSVVRTLFPILGVIFAILVLSAVGPLVVMRRKKATLPAGAERQYGIRGGAICPRCQRPFPLPIFAANLGFSKLTACPYCGKVGLMRVQPLEKLRAAERAELEGQKAHVPEESEDEKLKKELNDSKFQN